MRLSRGPSHLHHLHIIQPFSVLSSIVRVQRVVLGFHCPPFAYNMASFTADSYASPQPSTCSLYELPSLGRFCQLDSHHGGEHFPAGFLCNQVPHTHCYSLYMDRLQDHIPPHCKSYLLSYCYLTEPGPRRPSSLARQLRYSHSTAFFSAACGFGSTSLCATYPIKHAALKRTKAIIPGDLFRLEGSPNLKR
jgi:hypothetical protein